MSNIPRADRMSVEQALRHLSARRQDHEVVVSSMATARLLPRLSQHPLDLHYNPSTMGGAVPLGLGLALAQPRREITVLSGEGSLLMSLGCLVTVVASAVTNLSVLLLDNQMYEVTGGQQTAAGAARVDYVALARASGFQCAAKFETLEEWKSGSEAFFRSSGPRFACLEVGPTPKEAFTTKLLPIHERLDSFQRAVTADVDVE